MLTSLANNERSTTAAFPHDRRHHHLRFGHFLLRTLVPQGFHDRRERSGFETMYLAMGAAYLDFKFVLAAMVYYG